jgi:hypothetical protein
MYVVAGSCHACGTSFFISPYTCTHAHNYQFQTSLVPISLRDHVHLWITFVFVSNTCVSLGITKTSPEDHATLLAFHRFSVILYGICTQRIYTIEWNINKDKLKF